MNDWPRLDYAQWRETLATLQLWTQIVGKIRLKLTPWLNHGWHVPFYVTARGLSTSGMPAGGAMIDIEFDFVAHQLVVRSSRGTERALPLRPMSVTNFYSDVVSIMGEMGVVVSINTMPNEVPDPVAFQNDNVHASYDAEAVHRFWQALVQVDRVFKLFRSGFLGKSSPVHFFWGSFDLAVTRFSGRPAPLHPGGVPGLPDDVTCEAYSHEVSSAGFWPGSDTYPHAAFYSYAYPEPSGFRDRAMPAGAAFDATLGEFVLRYDAVCMADRPDEILLHFLMASYEAAAECGDWDRAALECPCGTAGHPRVVGRAGNRR